MADLPNTACNIPNNFYRHQIIFDITYYPSWINWHEILWCMGWHGLWFFRMSWDMRKLRFNRSLPVR